MSKPSEKEPQNGKRDSRNTLNDLTGKEWTYFLNSIELMEGEPNLITSERLNDLSEEEWAAHQIPVIDTLYPTSGEESYAHHIRKKHPSPKPPQLMKRLIEFFTKQGGWVLDPFVGAGSTLLACSMTGRHGIGIDLSEEYLDLYQKASEELNLEPQTVYQGDALCLEKILKGRDYGFDLVLTDPPYSNLLSRRRTGERKKKTGDDSPTPFTNESHDLGNMPPDRFYDALKSVIAKSLKFLKVKGYGLFGNVFTFIDASSVVSKTHLWEERDKAIAEEAETLNNVNVEKYAKDTEARWGAKSKSNIWFGYKRHESVDMRHGLINKVMVTPANVPD